MKRFGSRAAMTLLLVLCSCSDPSVQAPGATTPEMDMAITRSINKDLLDRGIRGCTKLQPNLKKQMDFQLLVTVSSSGGEVAVIEEATSLAEPEISQAVVACYMSKVKGTTFPWKGPAFRITRPYRFCLKPEHLTL